MPVDIVANESMTDSGDALGTAEVPDLADDLRPTVSIPVAVAYSHIHFGVWAGLGEAEKNGSQELADLGIGFVQNIDGSGVTERQGIGTATLQRRLGCCRAQAVLRRMLRLEPSSSTVAQRSSDRELHQDGHEFTGCLTGLAMLEGTLADNGFSGMKATDHHTTTWMVPAPSRASSAAASTGRPARRPLASSTSTAAKPARSAAPSAGLSS